MKRDLELIRHIMLIREESDAVKMCVADFETKDYGGKEISYHIQLLADAGFIHVTDLIRIGRDYPDFLVSRLTMAGHDYLDSIRSPAIWDAAKKRLGEFLLSAPLSVIQAVASDLIKLKLGI